MSHRVTRTHEIAAGHRVYGHEGKCANLHGHGYRFEFTCEPGFGLDQVGRVIDFSVMKTRLCEWLEDNWDHRLLLWDQDPLLPLLLDIDRTIIPLPVNPTAENLAELMVRHIAPKLLDGTGVRLASCVVHETSKCSARYDL